MKFKKGDMNNFVSVVLALIAIVGIVFLSVKLANFFVDQDMKNAKNFINSLNGKIENLNDGENNTFALRGIEGWVLVGWNKSVRIADDGETINSTLKPQKCFDKNCLCLCRESSSRCQEEGYCREIDRNVEVGLDYSFVLAPGQLSKKTVFVSCYIMPAGSNLLSLEIKKDISKILITGPVQTVSNYDEIKNVNSKCGEFINSLSFS